MSSSVSVPRNKGTKFWVPFFFKGFLLVLNLPRILQLGKNRSPLTLSLVFIQLWRSTMAKVKKKMEGFITLTARAFVVITFGSRKR